QRFNILFDSYREGVLVAFFTWVTELGSSAALLGIAVVSTGFVWAHGRGHLILPLWVSYAGAHATTWAGKFVFARERPESVAGVEALSPSFPSAHATGAMAVYGFVAYAIARDLASFRGHFEITYWTLVLIVLVGFSRIFLSVHYLSDVVTGLLVGGFWLLVGFAIAEGYRPRPGPPSPRTGDGG
ncbi:MAG: phosphatase PAP2 family protein, partial [Candidatus Competibacteraceae bacterium]|nr:phosphatase PAP2 family protein [Candidatus Competibacteraceae bacterium]